MSVVLHPRAAPGNRLQVWIGAFGRSSLPSLRWFLDGQEAAPAALRALASARETPSMAKPEEPRVFTGVYEFSAGIAPGSVHEVQAAATGEGRTERSPPLRVRTLPAQVPHGLGESFNVLLVSCFHQFEDRGGLAGNLVSQLPARYRPHLTLLLGDQVYLDLPTLANFRDRVDWLAKKFEDDYTANWRGPLGYTQVLDAAPSASVPDDHEYWNNAPHASPIIQNSWTAGGRDRWLRAARALYEAFQLSEPGRYEQPLILDVPPLSIFLMDNRTFRRPDLQATLPEGVLQQFQSWADHVVQNGRFGAVVTGQSLFQAPASAFQGKVADRHLANYGDYPVVMDAILKMSKAGRPTLCITGDVHFGRVIKARNLSVPGGLLYEVISSPSSLVTTIGADQVSQLRNAFRGLFGERDPWPRHSAAEEPPEVLRPAGLQDKLRCEMLFPKEKERQRGNHVALLSFRAAGAGLEVGVTYWVIDPGGQIGPPRELPEPIELIPGR